MKLQQIRQHFQMAKSITLGDFNVRVPFFGLIESTAVLMAMVVTKILICTDSLEHLMKGATYVIHS
jgi:hypothetical protein